MQRSWTACIATASCPLAKLVMGETAEVLADEYKIGREEQDQFALMSQQRAEAAIRAGRFADEIVPVTVEGKKGSTIVTQDEHPFLDATLEKLAKLKPVFSKTGTITAGNSSGITDGAAAMVLAGEEFVRQHNLKPLARIIAFTSAGESSNHGDWTGAGDPKAGRRNWYSAYRLRPCRIE